MYCGDMFSRQVDLAYDTLKKQVIVPMSLNNMNRIMTKSNEHISIIITTNRVAVKLDMKVVEKYIKNLNNIDSTEVINPRLPQSKSCLKILGISYFIKNIKLYISSDIVNSIIKSTHIFDNIVLSSCSQVIKASPKSNIVVWVHIWDLQNNINAKCLINRCFNIGYHIAMIKGMNMNSSIP